jgi:hypothetical protein
MSKLSARLYHGDTNLHFDEIMMSVLCWPHTYFDFHGPIPMKEKPVNRHVTPLEHITLIPYIFKFFQKDENKVPVKKEFEVGYKVRYVWTNLLTCLPPVMYIMSFEPRWGQIKDNKTGICWFSDIVWRSKSNHWLTRNKGNVFEWSEAC